MDGPHLEALLAHHIHYQHRQVPRSRYVPARRTHPAVLQRLVCHLPHTNAIWRMVLMANAAIRGWGDGTLAKCVPMNLLERHRGYRHRCRYPRSPPAAAMAVATFMNYVRVAWSYSWSWRWNSESILELFRSTLSHFSAARQFWGDHCPTLHECRNCWLVTCPFLDPSSDSASNDDGRWPMEMQLQLHVVLIVELMLSDPALEK